MKRLYIDRILISAGILILCTGCKSGNNYSNGIECYKEADYINAVDYFEKAVKDDPNNTDCYLHLGMAQIEICNYEEAITNFDAVLEKDDSDRNAYRGLGIAYYSISDYKNAEENLKKAIELSNDKYDELHIDSICYNAMCQYAAGEYEEAISSYTTALDHCDKSKKAELYYLRGCAYIAMQNENDAVIDFENSLDINGDDYTMYCNMYTSFAKAGYKERGESYLKRVISLNDSDDFLKGKTYYILGNYSKATEFLQNSVDSGNTEALYYLAMNYEALEDFGKADSLYHDYLAKNPNDSSIYNQYGAYLINRGKYENALIYIETGLELDKKDARQELLFNQAVCYEYLNDFDKAKELFTSYVAEYPNDKAAMKEYEFLMTR